jgi:phosphoribosylformylglycinamidine synthase
MNFAVVVFPGSNSDYDAFHAASAVLGERATLVWHKDTSLGQADAVILPGGFAHGDYLRTGAIARFSPIMPAVARFAARGGPVLGICNGFQVLLEAGLLPGAMVRNRAIKFVSRILPVRVEATDTPFTTACTTGQVLRLPIAHGEGNYFAEPELVAALEANRQVVFRYVDDDGQASEGGNPNGSVHNIAGICNAARNVVGLMPHPERASEAWLGSADGRVVLQSVVKACADGMIAGRPAVLTEAARA